MSLDAWKRAGAGTLRALSALNEFNKRYAKPVTPQIVERWVAWSPYEWESYTGATAEEAWMHAMQYRCEDKHALIANGWHVSLVQDAQSPQEPSR